MNLIPNMYKKNIYDINYEKLKLMGKKYLFFDLDNTIISYTDDDVNKEILGLFSNLQKMGFICFIFSNSHSKRLMKVKDKLNIDVFHSSMKPLNKNYKKVVKMYDRDKCVFIGDQFMTDILGAKKNNLYIILVDRIDSIEPLTTKFWRFFENIILKKYKKENKFIKGKYYE